jgi:hypothetical protein
MGEHSPVDALIPSVVCEWAVAGANGMSVCGGLAGVPFENIRQVGRIYKLGQGHVGRGSILSPRHRYRLRSRMRNSIARTLVSNSDHQVSYFEEWGGEEMKRVCKSQCIIHHQRYSLFHQ